jgi:anti-sigma B factor antagonist
VTDAVTDGWDHLVVDLRAVSFMDSAGVHLLLQLHALREDGVSCQMIDGRPEVHRVLSACGVDDVLERADPAIL